MSDTSTIIGQEALPIPAQPRRREPFHVVPYLNRSHGFIELEDLPSFDIDWDRELTYLEFKGEIAAALAAEPPQSPTWDKALDVHEDDYKAASLRVVEDALYYGRDDAIERDEVVTAGRRATSLHLPGIRGRDEGVAVTGSEFSIIARSPTDLAKAIAANTKKANDKRPEEERLDDETLKNTAGRSKLHGMEQKGDDLIALDVELKIERVATLVMNELVTSRHEVRIPMGEADFYRRVSSIAIFKTFEVAAAQLEYGTTRREGAERALVSAFYRGPLERRSSALHAYAKWAGYHIDAKRGKINQSLLACRDEYRKHRRFLGTKQTKQPEQAQGQ